MRKLCLPLNSLTPRRKSLPTRSRGTVYEPRAGGNDTRLMWRGKHLLFLLSRIQQFFCASAWEGCGDVGHVVAGSIMSAGCLGSTQAWRGARNE